MRLRNRAIRWAVGPLALITALATFTVMDAGTSAASSHPRTAVSARSSTSSCGPRPGVKATGSPIRLGGIATDQAGTSFTDITNMAAAYFACVNANGGINGHRIKYYIETEQTNPAQITGEAHQLVNTDHVVGIVGNTSIIECSVDYKYFESLGYRVIASGIAPQCYSTSNYADVNMGPRYSSDGAVSYAISKGAKKIVFDQSNVPGTGYNVGGVVAITKHRHIPLVQLTEDVPITDADAVAIKEVDDAGPNGAVILNFTPPDALVILQAAQKLGLEHKVRLWGCSTPCNTDFLSKSLGPLWTRHFYVNAELTPPDSTNTPTMRLYKAILHKYGKAVSGGIGSFSQMGFTEAKIMVHALESVVGPYTRKNVNNAILHVRRFATGMNCQLWTYGKYPLHIANNEDYTVTPVNGKMTLAKGCTLISSYDPQIAHYRAVAGTAPLQPGDGSLKG